MAGNNSIQFLRGNNISGSDEELLPGQPAYDLTTKYLYVGDGSKISETSPIKASFADDAENVTSTINGKNISDIFEENGTTAKEATNSPKSLYNLGAFDTYVDNGDGTVTVTRNRDGVTYPETLPANVPLNTLDANMSDIVRDEVEKTLNLYNHNNVSDFSGNVDASDFEDGTIDVDWGGAVSNATINFNAKNGATFSCSLNSASGGYWAYNMTWLYKDGSSEQMTTNQQVGTSGKFTFSSAAKEVIGIRLFVNLTWSASNVMINEGSHAYPYQPYNGAIVHEKQLNEYTPIGIKPYLSAHNSTSGSWVKFAEITVDTFCGFGAAFIISRGYESQAMCILRWQQRVGSNGSNTSTELSILAGDSIGSDIVLTDTDNGSSHTYALYFNTTTQDSYANISLLVDRAGNVHNMNFPTSAVMQGEPSNIIQRASVLLPGGGTVYGNLSITGQLDFASLSTRAANALLSMVELSESPLLNQRVSWGGPNAAWSTNGSTWSHSGTIMALGYVTELSTTGNVTSATYNSSTNRITYVISVNQNPGNNVYSGYVRYKYVIKEVK